MRLDHLLSERKENGAVYAPKPAEFLFFPFFIFLETRSLPDNKAGDTRSRQSNRKGGAVEGMLCKEGEVVTR